MTIIGANADIRFNDTNETMNVYISFGEYNEDTEGDSFGTADYKIFYYCENEDELKSFMTYTENPDDFLVLNYELEEITQ